jgi:hypothetical protein
MSADVQALSRLEAVLPQALALPLPPNAVTARTKLAGWANLLSTPRGKPGNSPIA